MPEVFFMAPRQQSNKDCRWDEKPWKDQVLRKAGKDVDAKDIIEAERLPKGFTAIPDWRYILRPEAVKSVFVPYRVTGREDLVEWARDMFTAIDRVTNTKLATRRDDQGEAAGGRLDGVIFVGGDAEVFLSRL